MAWTTPVTVNAGDAILASLWNEQVRDNLANLRALANVQQKVITAAFTQTVSATYADISDGGSNTMSVSITPTAATSKILICSYFTAMPNAAVAEIYYRLARGGTGILVGDAVGNRVQSTGHNNPDSATADSKISPVFLDSPNTTSAVTYSVQARTTSSTTTLYFNRSKTDTDANTFARTASAIIVQEIPA